MVVLSESMSTRVAGGPPRRDVVSRLEQVLRAGLAVSAGSADSAGSAGHDEDDEDDANERNVRQRNDTDASAPGFAVTVVVAKIGLLAGSDPQLRAEFGVSTNTRWQRTPETPWREMARVEYPRLPAYDETTLDGVVSLAKDAIMHEYSNDYIALHDRLEGTLRLEPLRVPMHRDVIIARRESLEAFLCLRSAIKPRENGIPRFLAIPADNGTGTEGQNEKLLHMYLLMGEVVKALENGRWHSQGTVQVSMAHHILDLEAEIDPLKEEEEDALEAEQFQMGGQQPSDPF